MKNFVIAEPPIQQKATKEKPANADVSTEVQKLNFKKFNNQTS